MQEHSCCEQAAQAVQMKWPIGAMMGEMEEGRASPPPRISLHSSLWEAAFLAWPGGWARELLGLGVSLNQALQYFLDLWA